MIKQWGLAAALALASAAAPLTVLAQTAPSTAVDPERLQLARQVMQANGGAEAMQAQLKNLFASVSAMTKKSLGPNASPDVLAMSDSLTNYMVDEEAKAMPAMVEDTATIYAQRLSTQELRDMLAWSRSASAQSIRAKMPAITTELLERQAPLMQKMMTGVMQKAIDRTCDQAHCTVDQRNALVAAMAKVLPSS